MPAPESGHFTSFELQAAGSFVNLMGDPTLRLLSVKPASNVSLDFVEDNDYELSWTESIDDILGYYVYSADDQEGPYTRMNLNGGNPITGGSVLLEDIDGDDFFMVRAVKLETSPSGTYYNLSQGAFTTGVQLLAAVNAGGSAANSLGTQFEADTSGSPSDYSNASSASSTTVTTATSIDTSRASSGVPIGTSGLSSNQLASIQVPALPCNGISATL